MLVYVLFLPDRIPQVQKILHDVIQVSCVVSGSENIVELFIHPKQLLVDLDIFGDGVELPLFQSPMAAWASLTAA